MKLITEVFKGDADFKNLLISIEKERFPISVTGLSLNTKAALLSAVAEVTGKKITVVTKDEAEAVSMASDLKSLGINAVNFPQRDYCIGQISGYSKEYEQKRTDTLSKLLDGDFAVLTVSAESAVMLTVPPEVLKKARFKIKNSESYSTAELTDRLLLAGYTRSEICEGKGQFSLRGGILDIFPVNSDNPYRIEFWGDDIDSIGIFDAETQRRTESADEISITPACEVIYNPQNLAFKLREYLENTTSLSKKQKERIEADIESLCNGVSILPDRYLPLIYEKDTTIFDYVQDTVMFVSESHGVTERLKSALVTQTQDVENYLEDGFLSEKTSSLFLSANGFWAKAHNSVLLESFPRSSYELPIKDTLNFDIKRSSPWSGNIDVLLEDISYICEQKGKVVILAGEERAAKLLAEQLREKGIFALYNDKPTEPMVGVTVTLGGLSGGFEILSQRFMLITHKYISSTVKYRRKKPKNAQSIGSLDELAVGDYVVHELHGIGVFDGINRITNAGVTKDYIKIKYAKSDVLYVPVTQLDLVSKYIGAASSDGGIKLNRLGSQEWQKTRHRVKAAVKDMAKQLTALYAKRMSVKGYAFSEDTDIQNDFERRFPFDETEDQLRCVNEIKRDMERAVPMDRLLCGDVGFGKTEVALRAAFKCISEGKQCALLVPTTILALQHFNTIQSRFGDMPVTVKLLNRFVPQKEQKKIISDLKCGRVDMVVGTHRLISKDVEFRDIGLVIIDEEQRFGVAQKERLKELYPSVDILTLSATPIPRTLNMAMSGLRDMSSIDEAPGDRHPVQTYVLEYNKGVIIDAINKEIRRGGQVYYLHNRVETIERCAAKLKQQLPDVNIATAHGKMSEDELTAVWQSLLEHEIDVLVCTTIIETGVDVPNANTLIIEDADRLGLAQLHQLRGRVGRSPRRAYAYFCFAQNRELSEVATKRLDAVRQFTEFGSGFKIAMRDLEIRGAGSILGGDQHGNMESVGYDMYLKLLSQAVSEENGEAVKDEAPCTVDLNVSAHIPEGYIESLTARLGIYKRIAAVRTDEDASDVIDELCDRFGEPPKSVMGLIDISLLRSKAADSGIYEITGNGNSVILHINSIEPEVVGKLTAYFKSRFILNVQGKPVYTIRLNKGQLLSQLVNELRQAL